ncbi:hypothetical protein MRX96_008273 [Rhipicephalus microplus]
MPTLPWQHKERLMEDHGLTPHQAQAITNEDGFLELFLKLVSFNDCEVKHIVNWLLLHLLAQLNKADITLSSSSLDAARFHELLILIQQQRISNTLAQEVLQLLTVINENPKDAKKAARGKERVLNSLMTKVNALSNSRAQMKIAKKIMSELLDKLK